MTRGDHSWVSLKSRSIGRHLVIIRVSGETWERFAAVVIDPPDLAPARKPVFAHRAALVSQA